MFKVIDWLNPLHTERGLRKRHVPFVLAGLAGFINLLVLLAAFVGSIFVTQHFLARGGYNPRAEVHAPVYHALGGAQIPGSWSLTPYIVRIHNQGTSNSCVGQALSTVTEIEAAERGIHVALSAGFVWNLATGGVDSPTTFQAGYGVLTQYGDAPLAAFPYDGATGYWAYPSPSAFTAAYPYRSTGWHQINVYDRYTIEYELHAGIPLAFAAPWYSSWVNNRASVMPSPAGTLYFWHVTTLVGYSPDGVTLLNSWGPTWGSNGRTVVPWGELAVSGGFLAVSDTALPWLPPPPPKVVKPHPFLGYVWYQYLRAHHRHHPAWAEWHDRKGHLIWAASVWVYHPHRLGGILHAAHWFPGSKKHHRYGFTKTSFQGGAIFTWPHWHKAKIQWWKRWQK